MAPPAASPSLALTITNLVLRILTFIFLIASVILIAINSTRAIVDDIQITANLKNVYAYRYAIATGVIGIGYTLLQIPFGIYHVSTGKPLVGNEGLLHFNFYGHKVISYLLATGAAATFGLTVDTKRFIDNLDDLLEDYGSGEIANLRSKFDHFAEIAFVAATMLLLAFFLLATSSIISSLALAKKTKATDPPTA